MNDRKRDAIALIEYVVRSPCRVVVLETLRDEGVVTRDALRARVDVVRTTLQRNLTGLVEHGLVRERDEATAYELTPTGKLVTETTTESISIVESAIDVRPVLEQVPPGELAFSLDRLTDATVVEASTANPFAPVERHEERLAETDRARLLLPATAADPLETSRDMVEEGAVHDVVVTPQVASAFRSDPSLSEPFEAMADSGSLSASVVDEEIPFYLGILDDLVQIGVHDENELPTALLESTDSNVREWAVDRFESTKRRAEPLV